MNPSIQRILGIILPIFFYKNYKIPKNNNRDVIELNPADFDLYSYNNKIKVNICAIVGKNGSGKSSIVDLVIKTINNFFFYYKKKHPGRGFHDVKLLDGIETSLVYKNDEGLFKLNVYPNKAGNDFGYEIYQYFFNSSKNQ